MKYDISLAPNTIHKSTSDFSSTVHTLVLKKGCTVLDIQMQAGRIAFWYEHHDDLPDDVEVSYEIFGTGVELPTENPYLIYKRTVQYEGLVWHVYQTGIRKLSEPCDDRR